MQKITGRDNQKIKFARKVRDRKTEDLIFVEGARLAEEVLRSDLKISDVFFTENFASTTRGKVFLQTAAKFNLTEVAANIFESISDTKHSQGVAVIAEKPETGKNVIEAAFEKKKRRFPLVVLVHEINNPSNSGAILRTCEAAGVSGVILTENSADVFSPKALRGAMGASLRIPIWANADFFEALSWAKEKNLISICADVNAEKSYAEIDWKQSRLLIFGSEAHGLSANEREKVDESLIIPMENEVESLNLAVACGVILFEAKRQSGESGA
ncbi:MAG TPA: RNA methyltransferase [Pyrinomonadaceae bacterium]|jgi:TrmH family RNA methyltransferase